MSTYSGTFSVAAVTKRLDDGERRAVVELWEDEAVRQWMLRAAPRLASGDLKHIRVSYEGEWIYIRTSRELSTRARQAIGYLYTQAFPGKVELHNQEWLTELEDTAFPATDMLRIVTEAAK